jgi:hypothetical protein
VVRGGAKKSDRFFGKRTKKESACNFLAAPSIMQK